MICPHCSVATYVDWEYVKSYDDNFLIKYSNCPSCIKPIIHLAIGIVKASMEEGYFIGKPSFEDTIYPSVASYSPNDGIPKKYIDDFQEARLVLPISPKVSAALTRRILQFILRDEYKIKARNLSSEIEKFITLPGIPSHISDAVDAVRVIGNLAAHPTKDNNTGEIVEVEKNEAEWLIEVIDALFDFTFIQPEKLKKRQQELKLKLEKVTKNKQAKSAIKIESKITKN